MGEHLRSREDQDGTVEDTEGETLPLTQHEAYMHLKNFYNEWR